jgi:Tetracyclin repressor-like, C-terminal domain
VGPETDRAAATVFMFALGSALGEWATVSLTRRLDREGADAEERFREAMAEAIEIGMRFPRLRARVEGGAEVGYATAPEHSFEFGLQVILDGLQNELALRPTPSDRAEP